MEVTLFYRTDEHHSFASYELIGVFTNKKAFRKYLRKMKKSGILTHEDMDMLENQNQTQGNDNNYVIETEESNPDFNINQF